METTTTTIFLTRINSPTYHTIAFTLGICIVINERQLEKCELKDKAMANDKITCFAFGSCFLFPLTSFSMLSLIFLFNIILYYML